MIVIHSWKEAQQLAQHCDLGYGCILVALLLRSLSDDPDQPVVINETWSSRSELLNRIKLAPGVEPVFPEGFFEGQNYHRYHFSWLPWTMEKAPNVNVAAFLLRSFTLVDNDLGLLRALSKRADVGEVLDTLPRGRCTPDSTWNMLLQVFDTSPWWWRIYLLSNIGQSRPFPPMPKVMPMDEDIEPLHRSQLIWRPDLDPKILARIVPDPTPEERFTVFMTGGLEQLTQAWPELSKQLGPQEPSNPKPFTGTTQSVRVFSHPHANLIAATLNTDKAFRARSDELGTLKVCFKNEGADSTFRRCTNNLPDAF